MSEMTDIAYKIEVLDLGDDLDGAERFEARIASGSAPEGIPANLSANGATQEKAVETLTQVVNNQIEWRQRQAERDRLRNDATLVSTVDVTTSSLAVRPPILDGDEPRDPLD